MRPNADQRGTEPEVLGRVTWLVRWRPRWVGALAGGVVLVVGVVWAASADPQTPDVARQPAAQTQHSNHPPADDQTGPDQVAGIAVDSDASTPHGITERVWDEGAGAWGIWWWTGQHWQLIGIDRSRPPGPAQPPAPTTPAPTATAAPGAGPIRVIHTAGSFSDPTGTSSTYHAWTPPAGQRARGLVVYLDGDGMHGVRNPDEPYALGGSRGIVAQAAARGFAVLAPATPSGVTWWQDGARNAAYVWALVEELRGQVGTQEIWWAGFSGGAQLITQYLLPEYGSGLSPGGAVVMGGGGAPTRGAAQVPPGYPMRWYTGAQDTGADSSDGYDALRDAQAGARAYAAGGADAQIATPQGVGHADIGGQMGDIVAGVLPGRPQP